MSIVGDEYRHPLGRTLTETDNVWFTALTMNTNQLHFNNHYSQGGLYRRTLVVPSLTLALVTGLSVMDVSQHVVANLGWDEVRMRARLRRATPCMPRAWSRRSVSRSRAARLASRSAREASSRTGWWCSPSADPSWSPNADKNSGPSRTPLVFAW